MNKKMYFESAFTFTVEHIVKAWCYTLTQQADRETMRFLEIILCFEMVHLEH